MRRIPEVAVAALAASAAATWLMALVTSTPPAVPVIVVQGEPAIAPGMPWALRFSAVSSSSSSRLSVEGEVRLGNERARIENGTARIASAAPGEAALDVVTGGVKMRGTVTVSGTGTDAATDAGTVSGTGTGDGTIRSRHDVVFTWSHWTREIALDAGAPGNATRAPVYPLDGRVSARLPSRVLVVPLGAPAHVVDVAPQVQGPVLPDGRVLAVDRTGLRLRLPLVVTGEHVDARVVSAEERTVSCDLVVDGFVHDVVTLAVAKDAPARIRLRASSRSGSAPGVAVVHCGGVWPDELGRSAIARLRPASPATSAVDDATMGDRAWVKALALRAGAPVDERILVALDAPDGAALDAPDAPDTRDEGETLRAALARVVPAKVRAPRLEVAWGPAPGPHATLRAVYAAFAILVVVGTLALGLVRVRGRRGAVAAGALVLAALLGGMYAALLVVAH